MPFISKCLRANPTHQTPGERCYIFYKSMLDKWNAEPRWKTADAIYAEVMRDEAKLDEQRAKLLAWQVFFVMKVLPYEEKQMEINGDIE